MANKYKEIKTLADALENVDSYIEGQIKALSQEYAVVGTEQAKEWRTGELLWEDEEKTIPQMRDVWGDVPKTEFTEDEKALIDTYRKIQKHLEKMI